MSLKEPVWCYQCWYWWRGGVPVLSVSLVLQNKLLPPFQGPSWLENNQWCKLSSVNLILLSYDNMCEIQLLRLFNGTYWNKIKGTLCSVFSNLESENNVNMSLFVSSCLCQQSNLSSLAKTFLYISPREASISFWTVKTMNSWEGHNALRSTTG